MMLIKPKLLIDTSWKDILAKNKTLKDNGLLKSLGDIKKLGDDDHDDAQKLLDEIVKLSGQLKKSKEAATTPAVTKFLAELASAADTAQKDVAKAKAEADKKGKDEAEAKKREEGKKDEDGDEGEEEANELLTTKMIPLLRDLKKGGHTMHVLVASAGKDVSVLISRKPISPAKRKLLADDLGLSGGIKYIVGHCLKEDGMTTFALKTQVAGMAKKLKAALMAQTGVRVKVRCRGEDGETDEEFEEEEEGGGDAQARGGRDGEGDAKGDGDGDRDRSRHNREADDGDGERKGDGDGVRAKKPSDGDEDDRGESGESKGGDDEENAAPAAKPRFDLAATPKVWKGTREMLTNRIDSFVAAVKQQVAGEGDAFAEEVGSNLDKLNRILAKLDKRLTNTLTNAAETDDPASRRQLLQEAKVIIAEYIRYVRSEPLIDHLDNNPFGIKTNLKATLSASLTQVARAIG